MASKVSDYTTPGLSMVQHSLEASSSVHSKEKENGSWHPKLFRRGMRESYPRIQRYRTVKN